MFSQNQDDAILSDRNEQQLFQSDEDSSEDVESENELEQNQEQLQRKDSQTAMYQEQQQLIKDETKKKDKYSFYEKIKGYIGFGHIDFLLNEKIGSILLIPISSEWTLKLQVTIAQIIIAIASLMLFLGMQYFGKKSIQQASIDWTQDNVHKQLTQQLYSITFGYIQIINQTYYNEIFIANFSMNYYSNPTTKYFGKLVTLNSELDDPIYLYVPNNSQMISYTFDYPTYLIMNQQSISESNIRKSMSFANFITYQYSGYMGCSYLFYINNGLFIQYPGINVSNITLYSILTNSEYNNLQSETNEIQNYVIYNEFINDITFIQTIKMLNDNNTTIGYLQIQRRPFYFSLLFYEMYNSQFANYTLFILAKNRTILTSYYLPNTTIDINELQELFYNLDSNTTYVHKKKYNYQQDNTYNSQTLYQYYAIYEAHINNIKIYFSFIQYEDFYFIILSPNFIIEQILEEQLDDYNEKITNFTRTILPIALSIPIGYIFICLLYMIREINPLQKITQLAFQSLQQTQKFNEKLISDTEGDGLIEYLTQLCKKLMINLNKSQQTKKQEIIDFFNKQTYPFNPIRQDTKTITQEIEKIELNQMEQEIGVLQFPMLDD